MQVNVHEAPDVYKDPFDRILLAQALAEALTVAGRDELLAHYGFPSCGTEPVGVPSVRELVAYTDGVNWARS